MRQNARCASLLRVECGRYRHSGEEKLDLATMTAVGQKWSLVVKPQWQAMRSRIDMDNGFVVLYAGIVAIAFAVSTAIPRPIAVTLICGGICAYIVFSAALGKPSQSGEAGFAAGITLMVMIPLTGLIAGAAFLGAGIRRRKNKPTKTTR